MGLTTASKKQSLWLCLPDFLVRCAGLSVAATLVLASLKLDLYTDLSWWVVLLPAAIALCITFVVLTVTAVVWVYVAYIFFTQGIEVDVECEFRLDVLFRTAKICFLGHGYVSLLMVSLGLFLVKLHHWPSLPLAYPLLPFIVLGMVYIFLAVVFKQPEVDPPWFFLVGMSLLSQSIMFVIKVDHVEDGKSLPWAATFTPSWLTYVLLLIYCVLSPFQTLREAHAGDDSSSAGSADTPYGAAEGRKGVASGSTLHTQFLKVAGIACWVMGWAVSQTLLSLRLDGLYKVAWLGVLLPAFLGWILLLIFATAPVCAYFKDIAQLLLDTFGLVLHGESVSGCVEQGPLLTEDGPVPWR